jgi:hypothetical protein
MTQLVSELYDMLRAAGVADDRAQAASRVTLYGYPSGFIAPLYDALRSVGVSEALARAAVTADYRTERPDD